MLDDLGLESVVEGNEESFQDENDRYRSTYFSNLRRAGLELEIVYSFYII